MKQVRIQINDLIDQHGATFRDCPGCSICSSIHRLRDRLLEDPADRFAHVLQKGQDMTKSDIAFLIENEVQRKTIMKSLQMGANDFFKMLGNFGLLKNRPKGEGEMAKITLEEYQDLKAKGMSNKIIAERKDMHATYLSQMKKQWGISAVKERAPKDHIKVDRIEEYESLIADLKAKVNSDESKMKNLVELIEDYQDMVSSFGDQIAAKDDRIQELEGSLVEAQNQIDYLHAACEDMESEASTLDVDVLKEKVERLEAELLPIRQLAYLKLKEDLGA